MSRDLRVVLLAFGMPVMMLVIFGYGVSTDVDRLSVAVCDQDRTRASRRLIEGLVAAGVFQQVANPQDPNEVGPLFKSGQIKAALIVPRGFQRNVARGSGSGAQFLIDGTDAATASISLGNALGIAVHIAPIGTSSQASLSAVPRVRSRLTQRCVLRTTSYPAL